MSRSARIASPTPGYCTFTATARPSWVMARCTWPIDAAAIGSGSHVGEHAPRVARPAPRATTWAASSALIGGAFDCSSAERLAHGLGQALVEVARHLAELHQGALHVPEGLGDRLRRLQLELRRRARPGARPTRTPGGPGGGRTGPPALAPMPAIAALRAVAARAGDRRRPAGCDAAARLRASWTASDACRRRRDDAEHLGDGPGLRHGRRGYRWPLGDRFPLRCPAMDDLDAINLALLALRCGIGAVMLAHGINHIFGGGKIAGTARWFESLGMKPGIAPRLARQPRRGRRWRPARARPAHPAGRRRRSIGAMLVASSRTTAATASSSSGRARAGST